MSEIAQIGGKGKGLVWLSQNTDLGYKVPEFDIIDASFYDEAMKQLELGRVLRFVRGIQEPSMIVEGVCVPKRLEERCTELAQRFTGRGIAVRSSGLISEDNDKFSGAGIYDSFFLEPKELTPQNLQKAVLRVYASVDSERAVDYRRKAELGDERMAVVVQEIAEGENGVAMSRLPSRAGIIPVSWSEIRGAVVQGIKKAAHTVFVAEERERYHAVYEDENLDWCNGQSEYVQEHIGPLIKQLRQRYGRDFELEFAVNMPRDSRDKKPRDIYLLQIRPLTNIQDKKVKFPRKKPIFKADYCMGVGEYIGPWFTPREVSLGWKEPEHYAYVTSRLEKTIPSQRESSLKLMRMFGRADEDMEKNRCLDYDLITPNKRAMVLTHSPVPGSHAMTVANERGILCLAGEGHFDPLKKLSEIERKLQESNRNFVEEFLGYEFANLPEFDISLEDVGHYIHIVSDGLRGEVYRATKKEAVAFAQKEGLKVPK